jgi:hypothetical protein
LSDQRLGTAKRVLLERLKGEVVKYGDGARKEQHQEPEELAVHDRPR